MKKIIIFYIALTILIGITAFIRTGKTNLNFINLVKSKSPSLTINNKKFNLKIAKTDEERLIGLSKTNKLKQDEGMLFVFPEKDYYGFWMKNMKFPIDIIFISDQTIVDVYEKLQIPKDPDSSLGLPVYKPKEKANYILEINSGVAAKYQIKPGEKVIFQNLQ